MLSVHLQGVTAYTRKRIYTTQPDKLCAQKLSKFRVDVFYTNYHSVRVIKAVHVDTNTDIVAKPKRSLKPLFISSFSLYRQTLSNTQMYSVHKKNTMPGTAH